MAQQPSLFPEHYPEPPLAPATASRPSVFAEYPTQIAEGFTLGEESSRQAHLNERGARYVERRVVADGLYATPSPEPPVIDGDTGFPIDRTTLAS